MLCHPCSEHFSFSRPDIVARCREIKQEAIDEAIEEGFDSQNVSKLRQDLERYKNELVGVEDKTCYPKPWTTSPELDDLFSTRAMVEVWDAENCVRTLQDIRASATTENCQLCVDLNYAMRYLAHDHIQASAFWLESDIFLEHGSCVPAFISFRLCQPEKESEAIFRLVVREASNDVQYAIELPGNTADERCIEFFSKSLTYCSENHEECRQERTPGWIPKRLLDIGRALDEIVLTEGDELQQFCQVEYVTLSYVWGEDRFMSLTHDNLVQLKAGFALSELPRCFQDAISIVRRLGIRFLWIDALCIIQDSEADWAEQATSMNQIYQCGVVSLAACDITNPSNTLFSERTPTASNIFHHCQEFSDSSVTFSLTPDWAPLVWERCQLYQRGWTLQERWLSPRVLFLSRFPVWLCKQGLYMERIPPSTSSDIMSVSERSRLEVGWKFGTAEREELRLRWWSIVRDYTKGALTYRTDKLIALSGVAKKFASIMREPYYGGLWGGEELLAGLLWVKATDVDEALSIGCEEYIAPSWSWASCHGAVILHSGTVSSSLVQVVTVSTVARDSDEFGRLKGGELVLKGFVFKVWYQKKKHDSLGRGNLASGWLYFMPIEVGDDVEEFGEYLPFCRGLLLGLVGDFRGHKTYRRLDQLVTYELKSLLSKELWERIKMLSEGREHRELITII